MDIYTYIGVSKPSRAINLIRSYGYDIHIVDGQANVPKALRQLVSQQGEVAFLEMLDLHPDKELFEEIYEDKANMSGNSKECTSCKEKQYNMTGPTNAAILNNQTNLYTLLGAVVIAGAILFTQKN